MRYDLKIGLIDVDSHNFPNLCLMKLSAYHKAKGHKVEWWNAKGRYDLVYKSRVFTDTYSKDTITVTNAEQVILGGTGYDTKKPLAAGGGTQLPGLCNLPAVFRDCLRLFEPGLSEELRFLHCQRQGGTQKRQGCGFIRVLEMAAGNQANGR